MNIVKGEWYNQAGNRTVLYLDTDAIAAVSVVWQGTNILKCTITLQSGEALTTLGYELCRMVISEMERRVQK